MQDSLDRYDFELPPELIAQAPLPERDRSRMMVLRRGQDGVAHRVFRDLPAVLPPDALLVMNNTRVQPRRLAGQLPGGTAVEALLVEAHGPGRWAAMVRKARRLKPGMRVDFADGHLPATAEERTAEGYWVLAFDDPQTFSQRLERHGLAPLPPYIRREVHAAHDPQPDRQAYQTVYARQPGALAAPTAGLHFTPAVLQALEARGIDRVELTLHVGVGTFAPVQTDDPALHTMHREWYELREPDARRIQAARAAGRPVVAIGTTSVRALESWAALGSPEGHAGWSDLFIRPPFTFRAVDGLVTNFHLPRSTLLMLVSAFHGRERVLAAYREAVAQGYRFFSFGDCMVILPAGGHPSHP